MIQDPNAFMMAFALAIARLHGTYSRENIDVSLTTRPRYVMGDFQIRDIGNVSLPFAPNIATEEWHEVTLTLRVPGGTGSFVRALQDEYASLMSYAGDGSRQNTNLF